MISGAVDPVFTTITTFDGRILQDAPYINAVAALLTYSKVLVFEFEFVESTKSSLGKPGILLGGEMVENVAEPTGEK
jgi:hypothetical protein